jgi:hypothetical protein
MRDYRLFIKDILVSIGNIQEYTSNMNFEDFCKDGKTIDAVMMKIGIIGEAVRNIPEDVKNKYPEVPWTKLKNMRNTLIHRYFDVDCELLWQSITKEIPDLRRQIADVLEREER